MLDADSSSSVLSFLSPVFGEGVRASSLKQTGRPPLLGGGTVSTGATFYTLCNEVPKEPLDFMKDLAKSYWPGF